MAACNNTMHAPVAALRKKLRYTPRKLEPTALAVAIAARPAVPLLLAAAAWKLASETLWMTSGAPWWEYMERAGSYVAPLALAALLVHERARGSTGAGACARGGTREDAAGLA